MDKVICFLHSENTHLHELIEYNYELSKKNLYHFGRLVLLNYEIGIYKNKNFITNINSYNIVKPRSMYINEDSLQNHNITQTHANDNGLDIITIINEFKKNINNVDIIIGYNIELHLKLILGEAIRYNIYLDFSNYIIIDINNFNHNHNSKDVTQLYTILNPINEIPTKKLDMVIFIFFKLYSQYKKSLKKVD